MNAQSFFKQICIDVFFSFFVVLAVFGVVGGGNSGASDDEIEGETACINSAII